MQPVKRVEEFGCCVPRVMELIVTMPPSGRWDWARPLSTESWVCVVCECHCCKMKAV